MHPLFGSFGYAYPLRRDDPVTARRIDAELDAALAMAGFPERFLPPVAGRERRKVLAVVTARPVTADAAIAIAAELRASCHDVRLALDSRESVWKFTKINQALLPVAGEIDWLVVADDDVSLPRRFLDDFIACAERAALVLAQPAHRIHSYASYEVTQRKARSIARATHFVEIGQVLAIHRSILAALLPFPENRSGWGIDFLWADMAQRHGWRIGVVDATPFEHLQPVAASYDQRAAMEDASILLDAHAPAITRDFMLSDGVVAIGW